MYDINNKNWNNKLEEVFLFRENAWVDYNIISLLKRFKPHYNNKKSIESIIGRNYFLSKYIMYLQR